jgi:hypothetical protein
VKPRERDDVSVAEESERADALDASGLGLPDDRILGEISHEMGNYFHKLYYWTEYLRDRNGYVAEADRTAFDMLEGTVERLEHFMRMILEYFAPARLSFTRLRAEDLVGGLRSRLIGRKLKIEGDATVRSTAVLADAALIGHALRTIFETAAATLIDEDEMIVRLVVAQRREFRGIEIDFLAGRGAAAAKTLAQGIEIAVAEKFIQMPGGELFERRADGTGPRALVVFLPIYA